MTRFVEREICMNSFQERLSDLLNENNMSRLKLSKIINVSSTTINGYFNNNYYPEINIAIKIAEYFECSLDYLFGISDEIKNHNKNHNNFFYNFNYLILKNNQSVAKTMRDLNMSEYNYYRWKGGQMPKTSNIIEISKYFDVGIDYLLGNKL